MITIGAAPDDNKDDNNDDDGDISPLDDDLVVLLQLQ